MALKTVRDPTLPSVPPEEERDDFERITRFRKGQLTTLKELQESVYDDLSGMLAAVYPVGSIYISTLATNPATLFDFGTWVAFGAGKTLVGLDAGQTEFDTVEETGGAKTHTLSVAELAVHTHVQNAHSHSLADQSQVLTTTNVTSESADLFKTLYDGVTHGNYKNQIQATTAENQNTGSGSAHNNLQPYIVVYMWKRTA